jgi:hypothetical protein
MRSPWGTPLDKSPDWDQLGFEDEDEATRALREGFDEWDLFLNPPEQEDDDEARG